MTVRNSLLRFSFVAVSALSLGACVSTPAGPPLEVVRLQGELDRLHGDQRVAGFADAELSRADSAVRILAVDGRRLDQEQFQHGVYIAERLVQTAEAAGLARYAEYQGKELGTERDRLVVEARSRDLIIAQATASAALQQSERDRLDAEMQRREAEASRSEALSARAELEMMRDRLVDLEARETERGLVITLGDVLFETGRSELKPGGQRELDKIAAALRDDRSATIAIEGHTDSVGGRDYNLDLSERRAASVRNYLAGQGIPASRLTSRGLGPDYPVATNSDAAGRQQNRRVEVVVSTQVALNRPR
jgi:outer membrane protein OmpA-like peptidoglycan-associated protein